MRITMYQGRSITFHKGIRSSHISSSQNHPESDSISCGWFRPIPTQATERAYASPGREGSGQISCAWSSLGWWYVPHSARLWPLCPGQMLGMDRGLLSGREGGCCPRRMGCIPTLSHWRWTVWGSRRGWWTPLGKALMGVLDCLRRVRLVGCGVGWACCGCCGGPGGGGECPGLGGCLAFCPVLEMGLVRCGLRNLCRWKRAFLPWCLKDRGLRLSSGWIAEGICGVRIFWVRIARTSRILEGEMGGN